MRQAWTAVGIAAVIAGVWVAGAGAPALAQPANPSGGGYQHTHTPVPEAVSFRHAVRMMRGYQDAVKAILDAGDADPKASIGSAHDPAWAIGVLSRRVGRLAAERGSEVPRDRVRTMTRVGKDLDNAADALHDACDGGDRRLARAKFAEVGKLIDELERAIPRRWVCDMQCEPGRVETQEILCPVCKMKFRPWEDVPYVAAPDPQEGIAPGTPTTFTIRLMNPSGGPISPVGGGVTGTGVNIVQVDRSLGWVNQAGAEYDAEKSAATVTLAFPAPGPGTLFAEFTPVGGDAAQARPAAVTIAGEAQPRPELKPTVENVLSQDGWDFRVRCNGEDLVPGVRTFVRLGIDAGGTPVEPAEVDGVRGQLIAVHQGRGVMVRGQPLDPDGEGAPLAAAAAAMGNAKPTDLHFGATFPEPGLYVLFFTVQKDGSPVTARFVADVKPGAGGTPAGGHEGHEAHSPK
jgi:hypothetical protein